MSSQSLVSIFRVSINQLLSTTYEICKPLDDRYGLRDAFVDMSKVFDKVLHNGLIYKLEKNGVSG